MEQLSPLSMATNQNGKISVSSLLSPPEPPQCDSFSSSASLQPAMPSVIARSPAKDEDALPPSPPMSHHGNENQFINDTHIQLRDPPLFGPGNESFLTTNVPLFAYASAERLAARSPRTREGYGGLMTFSSICWGDYNKHKIAFVKRERELLKGYGRGRVDKTQRYQVIAPAPVSPRKALKISNARPTTEQPAKRVHKRTPKAVVYHALDATPKAPRPPANREDIDYNNIPDMSPDLNALNLGKNALKTDWKGQMLDLTRDPDAHLLHEQEIQLAATLRLSAATYLCSKRRIFEARVQTLRRGKEFRKTDAQQACKIDVNKASKLWTVYERNGMFKPAMFRHYLNSPTLSRFGDSDR